MEALRQYVISVAAAGIICGIINGLSQKSSAHKLLKLITGLFLVVTVIRPILSLDLNQLIDQRLSFPSEAEEASAMGEKITMDNMKEIIKAETEAYILDKAEELHIHLSANVTVSSDPLPVPVSVTISGSIPETVQKLLGNMITEDLGIPKENQQWIGQG